MSSNRPTIGGSLLNIGSRWAVVLRCGLSKPSSQESRGGSYGSVKWLVSVGSPPSHHTVFLVEGNVKEEQNA